LLIFLGGVLQVIEIADPVFRFPVFFL